MAEIRRILLALDPGMLQSRTLELAAALAAEVSAEIDALLIESAALRTAASLPFTRETLTSGGAARAFTPDDLALTFQMLARQAQRRFARLVGPRGLRWTLRSVSGDPIAEIAAAAPGSDLLIVGRSLDGSLGFERMRRIARQLGRPVVFLGDAPSRLTAVSLVFEGSDFNGGSLAIAGALARALSGEITIYHPQAGSQPSQAEALRSAAAALPHGLRVVVAALAGSDPADDRERAVLVIPEQASRRD